MSKIYENVAGFKDMIVVIESDREFDWIFCEEIDTIIDILMDYAQFIGLNRTVCRMVINLTEFHVHKSRNSVYVDQFFLPSTREVMETWRNREVVAGAALVVPEIYDYTTESVCRKEERWHRKY